MTRNKRRHQRVKPRALSSRVRVAGALHIGLAVENLSMGGAFVRCATVPALRTPASIELAVPGVNGTLTLPGEVVHVVPLAEAQRRQVPAGFSIEFTDPLPPHSRAGLQHLLKSIDPSVPIEVSPVPGQGARAAATPAPSNARTVAVPAFEPPSGDSSPSSELATLRKLVASQERELARLREENDRLREAVRVLKAR